MKQNKDKEIFLNECEQFFAKLESTGKFAQVDQSAKDALVSLFETIEQINIYQWYSFENEKKDVLAQSSQTQNATINKMHVLLYLSIELLQGSVNAQIQEQSEEKEPTIDNFENDLNEKKENVKENANENENEETDNNPLSLDFEEDSCKDNENNENEKNNKNDKTTGIEDDISSDKQLEQACRHDWYLNSIIGDMYKWFLDHKLDANVKSGLLIYLMATFDNNPYVVKYIASVIDSTLQDYGEMLEDLSPFIEEERKEFLTLHEEIRKYLHVFTNTLQLMTSQNADKWIERKKAMKQYNIGGMVKRFMREVLRPKQTLCEKFEREEKEQRQQNELIRRRQKMEQRIAEFRCRMEEPQFEGEYDENDDFSDIMGHSLIKNPMNDEDGECVVM